MENLTHEEILQRDADMLYDAIVQRGLTYKAAIIQTNVFDGYSYDQQRDVLSVTLSRLDALDHEDEEILRTQFAIREAIRNNNFFHSPQRQRQLDQQVERSIARDASTTSSQYRLTREAPVHYFTSIDGTTAQVTGVSKALDDQLPEGK